jgi:hypothetical protein
MKLNSITEFHVHSYAIRTGRSDASALAELVKHGYEQFFNALSDANHGARPTQAEQAAEKAGARTLTVYLPLDTIGALQATARAERRSVSNIAKQILGEGIASRRIASLDTGKIA